MSDQEREGHPPEPAPEPWSLEEPPRLEEELSQRLSDAAEAVTSELNDLQEALVPAEPAAVAGDEQPFGPAEVLSQAEPESMPGMQAGLPAGEPRVLPAAGPAPEGTSDDRLISALAWLTMVILQLPIVSVIQLLSPTNKERPFQKHHAVTSLIFFAAAIVYEVVAGIAYAILGLVTLGIGFACLWVLFFVPHLIGLYYALQAYNGKRVELPILSDIGRSQGWM